MTSKSRALGIMLSITGILIVLALYTPEPEPSCDQHNQYGCEAYGWEMDTIYNVDSSRYIVSLHYYQEIEYITDSITKLTE